MATHPYPHPIHNSHHFPEQNYRYVQWGASPPSEPSTPYTYYINQPYPPDFYPPERRQNIEVNMDYSNIADLDTGFKKLKSNQISILKQLKREYELLRNTELDQGLYETKKIPTDRSDSNDQSMSKSRSDARSSSYSRIERTRRKSQHKDLQVAALERKQMEVMLNNSMKKIEQLLSSQIELKKTVLQLRSRLEGNESQEEEYQYTVKKHREEVDSLKRSLEQSKKQNESQKIKLKEYNNIVSTLEGEIAVNHLQIKKKDERIRILQEQVYLQKNRYCNLQLDLKKCRLEAEMQERSQKQQLAALERRLNSVEKHELLQKNQEIKKLTQQLELKEERYNLLLAHNNKKEEISQDSKQNDEKNEQEEKKYIKSLEKQIERLKKLYEHKSSHSEEVLTSILEKLSNMPAKSEQQFITEINSLRKDLEKAQNQSKSDKQVELNRKISVLESNISEMEKNMQEENIEKMYFIQDIKKIKAQMAEERRRREEAEQEARQLQKTLRKVEQEANKYSYELNALRTINMDLAESKNQNKSLMLRSQQVQIRELELSELKEEKERLVEELKSLRNEYEEEIKQVKRKVAEEEIKSYKIKQELELKMALARTEYQTEYNRVQIELERTKKAHAIELSQWAEEKTQLQGKIMEKNHELERITNQLNAFVKERDSVFQAFRAEQEKKVQIIQDENSAKVTGLANKVQALAELGNKHAQSLHKIAFLEQEAIDMKRALRHNRRVNDGIDHLWQVKEAEYSNLNQILKALN